VYIIQQCLFVVFKLTHVFVFEYSSGAYVFLPRNNSPIAFEGIPSVVVAGLQTFLISLYFNHSNRRRVAGWRAGGAAAVRLLGGNHVSPSAWNGTR
jgi:hypothetical protein